MGTVVPLHGRWPQQSEPETTPTCCLPTKTSHNLHRKSLFILAAAHEPRLPVVALCSKAASSFATQLLLRRHAPVAGGDQCRGSY